MERFVYGYKNDAGLFHVMYPNTEAVDVMDGKKKSGTHISHTTTSERLQIDLCFWLSLERQPGVLTVGSRSTLSVLLNRPTNMLFNRLGEKAFSRTYQ